MKQIKKDMKGKFLADKIWIAIKNDPQLNENKFELLVEGEDLKFDGNSHEFCSIKTGKAVLVEEVYYEENRCVGWSKKNNFTVYPVDPREVGCKKEDKYVTKKILLKYENEQNEKYDFERRLELSER